MHVKALEEYLLSFKYVVFFLQKGPRSLGDMIAACNSLMVVDAFHIQKTQGTMLCPYKNES